MATASGLNFETSIDFAHAPGADHPVDLVDPVQAGAGSNSLVSKVDMDPQVSPDYSQILAVGQALTCGRTHSDVLGHPPGRPDHDNGHVVKSTPLHREFDERDGRWLRIPGGDELTDLLIGDVPGQSVAAQDEDVRILKRAGDDFQLRLILNADGTGDDIAWPALGFLRGNGAPGQHLLRLGMVTLDSLFDRVVAHPIEAAVRPPRRRRSDPRRSGGL